MRNLLLFIFLLFVTVFFSCKKKDIESLEKNHSETAAAKSMRNLPAFNSGTCVEDADDGSGYDSILKPTFLVII